MVNSHMASFQGEENVIRLDCSYVTLFNVLNQKKKWVNFIICRLISLAAATNGKKPFWLKIMQIPYFTVLQI